MAQQMATKNMTVSKAESMVLMKNMIRISISSICYIRDLFPHSCFKSKPYGNVEVHQLQGATKDDDGEIVVSNADAFLLTQWLEQGVFHALEQEYLSSVTFAIYSQHPVTQRDILLETYEFRTTFQRDGDAPKINDVSLTKDAMKNQAAKFIRALTEFSGTLDALPDKCWITLQLKYYDNAPADYEPEYFRASDGSISASAERMPLVINVGNIRTPSMDMKLKYAGLDSLLFSDLCKVDASGDTTVVTTRSSEQSVLCAANCAISSGMQRMDVNDEETAAAAGAGAAVSPFTTQNTAPHSPLSPEEAVAAAPQAVNAFDRVREHVLQKGVVSVPNCAKDLDLPQSEVRTAFNKLASDGVIKRRGKGFQLPNNAAAAPHEASTAPAAPAADRAQPATVPSAPGHGAVAPPAFAMTTPQDSPQHSCAATSVSTASRLAAAPPAPRKTGASKASTVPEHVSPHTMTDDIEETYQENVPPQPKRPVAYHQPALALKKGSATVNAAVPEQRNENAANSDSRVKGKRSAQQVVEEEVMMSQESLVSEASSVGGTPRKRARKTSTIRDPLRLTDLRATAKANRHRGSRAQE